jgi:hypothetical protein
MASLSLWVAFQLAARPAAGQQSRSVTGRIRPGDRDWPGCAARLDQQMRPFHFIVQY